VPAGHLVCGSHFLVSEVAVLKCPAGHDLQTPFSNCLPGVHSPEIPEIIEVIAIKKM
jgi:hypothetical protein